MTTRQTKTELKLQQALTELLPTKGLASMTVSDICRTAGINRGTFYAHYIDKYDLVDKQVERLTDDLKRIVFAPGGGIANDHELIPQQRVLEVLRYVKDDYALIAALIGNGTNMELRERVQEIIGELLEQSARRHGLTLSYGGVPADYGRAMVLSGITSVIWLWIKKGCVEPPEEISRIVWTNKSCSPQELLE